MRRTGDRDDASKQTNDCDGSKRQRGHRFSLHIL